MYLPSSGGVERYTHNLACALRARGCEVVIVTSLLPGLPREERTPEGILVLRVPSWLPLRGRLPLLRPSARRALQKRLDQLGVGRVIVQTRLYPLSLFGMRYAARLVLPFLTIEHGSDYIIRGGALAFPEHCYEKILLRRAKKLCRRWYAVSDVSRRWLERFGVRCEGVLYNFIEPEQIPARHEKMAGRIDRGSEAAPHSGVRVRTEMGSRLSGGEVVAPVVVFCGRLLEEKGVLKLVGAMRRVWESGEMPQLILLGEGPLEERLREIAKDCPQLRLLGRRTHAEVLDIFARSDIFCLPTDYPEGLPTVLLEAAACGCYLIAADRGGAREVISSPAYGTLLPDTSVGTIERALREALREPERRYAAAEAVRRRVTTEFTAEKTARETMRALGIEV